MNFIIILAPHAAGSSVEVLDLTHASMVSLFGLSPFTHIGRTNKDRVHQISLF